MGLRDRIARKQRVGRIKAELARLNGERLLVAAIKSDPDGGLLIHRAIERGEAV